MQCGELSMIGFGFAQQDIIVGRGLRLRLYRAVIQELQMHDSQLRIHHSYWLLLPLRVVVRKIPYDAHSIQTQSAREIIGSE